jgi:hypothetical protein
MESKPVAVASGLTLEALGKLFQSIDAWAPRLRMFKSE